MTRGMQHPGIAADGKHGWLLQVVRPFFLYKWQIVTSSDAIPLSTIRGAHNTKAKFDEDSEMYARLERWSVGSEALSESLMLRRRTLFDVEKGFDTRRKTTEALNKLLAYWQRYARDRSVEFRGWRHSRENIYSIKSCC